MHCTAQPPGTSRARHTRAKAHGRPRLLRPRPLPINEPSRACQDEACSMAHALPATSQPAVSRRGMLWGAAALCVWQPTQANPAAATTSAKLGSDALAAFQAALASTGDFEARDAAWSRVLELAPTSSAGWSNRGTLRLQYGRWAAAESDLARAVILEAQPGSQSFGPDALALLTDEQLGQVDASTLNNLGNAEVALGKLSPAQAHFQIASRNPGLREIALANLALAAFEAQEDQVAIRVARQVLRRDPAFLDASAALVAFLYGSGQTAAAEEQWEELQRSEDGFGGYLYNKATAIQRVQGRWPPRATAALDAFINVTDTGTATGYDLAQRTYKFPM